MFGFNFEMDGKLALIRAKILAKLDVSSSFADPEVQARKLKSLFKFNDATGGGTLSFDEFTAAMIRLNFVGCDKDLHAWFGAFDHDGSGTVDYSEMANAVFGLGPESEPRATLSPVIERIRATFKKRGAANGIRSATQILRRLDANGSRNLDKLELRDGLAVVGVVLNGKELGEVMQYFDADGSGEISVTEFLSAVRGSNYSTRRAQIVELAWSRLETEGDGVVTLNDLAAKFDTSKDPEVIDGTKTESEALQGFMACWDRSGDKRLTRDEFYEYYRDLSTNIEDDDYFELMVRNAWHISGGEGWCANTSCLRVLVTHSDGGQEVVEVKDDLGLDVTSSEAIIKMLDSQGVEDIVAVDAKGGV